MWALTVQAAKAQGLDPALLGALVWQESRYCPEAVSSAGALGLGQLMPGTARGLGVNPHDPRQNISGAARYLRQQYDTFANWQLALAAYNAGPGAVQKYGGIPPYPETQAYVPAVLAYYRNFSAHYAGAEVVAVAPSTAVAALATAPQPTAPATTPGEETHGPDADEPIKLVIFERF